MPVGERTDGERVNIDSILAGTKLGPTHAWFNCSIRIRNTPLAKLGAGVLLTIRSGCPNAFGNGVFPIGRDKRGANDKGFQRGATFEHVVHAAPVIKPWSNKT